MNLRTRLERILTHDFSPWANRHVYWLKSPLGLLIVAAVVALICGLSIASQGFVVFAAIVMVLGVGIIWPRLGLCGVACELSFGERRVHEGEPVPVTVSIVNRWPIPVWGLAIEKRFFVTSDSEAGETAVALAQIGPWSKTDFEWEFTPECRGSYPQSPPVISTAFPFGLWTASRPIRTQGELLVWPRTFELDGLPLPPGRQLCVATASDQRAGTEGETIGARPYRLGDSLRSVHWALTARHDRFLVRERQDSAQSKAVIVVEASPNWHSPPGGQSSLEWSIRIAASAAAVLLEQGALVRLCIGGNQVDARPGNAGLRQVLDLLARFDAASRTSTSPSRHWSEDREAGFAIEITTDLAQRALLPGAQQIVLNTAAFGADEDFVLHELETPRSWIEIDNPRQVPAQVARQWRRHRQEVFRGV